MATKKRKRISLADTLRKSPENIQYEKQLEETAQTIKEVNTQTVTQNGHAKRSHQTVVTEEHNQKPFSITEKSNQTVGYNHSEVPMVITNGYSKRLLKTVVMIYLLTPKNRIKIQPILMKNVLNF